MSTVIDRSVLTDHLLERLQPESDESRVWSVGDHEKPKAGGWQGTAGRSEFVPYIVLTATPSQAPTGSVAKPNVDVWFGYALTSVGTHRDQVEKTAAMARERLLSLRRTKTDDGRSVSSVQVTRYGGVDRLPTEPPLYLVTDQVSMFTSQ